MSRGAALIRVDPGEGDARKPVLPRELEIASLARKPPSASQPAGRQAKPVIRLKVALFRSGLGVHPSRDYFELKLNLARALRRKLRVAIVEVDDCEQPAGHGDPFELTLDPPDPKRLMRLRAAVRRLLRASGRNASA
jgi:hypothetical protein